MHLKEIQVFKNELFGEIRTLTGERGEPLFVGKDVATALGYSKSRNALAAHVDEEDKTTALIQGPGSNYKSKAVLINECTAEPTLLCTQRTDPFVKAYTVTTKMGRKRPVCRVCPLLSQRLREKSRVG